MIFDFSHTCKTYDKNFYTKDFFKATPCPKCGAIGRFNMHGAYGRHVTYFEDNELVHTWMDVKRIKCKSCKSTHAVMPGDLIPYRLLSLYVVISVLIAYYSRLLPALKIADDLGFAFQFIYSVLKTFRMYLDQIHQYFMETAPGQMPADRTPQSILALIQKPYLNFQYCYTKLNRHPCFMCKFHNKGGAPPIGLLM